MDETEISADDGFFLGAYSCDGNFHGTQRWKFSDLAPHWLSNMRALLLANGHKFKINLPGPLARIKLHCTAISTSALVSIYVNNSIVITGVLLSGLDRGVDSELSKLFLDSTTKSLSLTSSKQNVFTEMLDLNMRPLAIFILWTPSEVSVEDLKLTQEVLWHFAGAFFTMDGSYFLDK